MPANSQEEVESRIYDYAWHYVNTCAGIKSTAYNKMLEAHGEKPKTRYVAHEFHKRHAEKVDEYIAQFRAENRKEYPQIRDNNIAILTEIAAEGSRNSDRISAIKELDSIMGYNAQNINVNGRMDSEIEVNITNL